MADIVLIHKLFLATSACLKRIPIECQPKFIAMVYAVLLSLTLIYSQSAQSKLLVRNIQESSFRSVGWSAHHWLVSGLVHPIALDQRTWPPCGC